MRLDDRSLGELIDRSQDLQSDALKDARVAVRDMEELRADRGDVRPEPEQVAAFDDGRRAFLRRLGLTGGGIASRGLVAGGLGAGLLGILAKPAAADTALDIQILQTAASLENLAVATYEAALGLPFIKDGNKTIVAFAQTTMKQHAEHGAAFNAQAKALGGQQQTSPNPQYLEAVEKAKPTLKSPLDVVNLAALLEEVASDTYLDDLGRFEDVKSRTLMASVMGVEVQHLATLNAVRALLEGGAEALIKIPTDLAKLPAAAGSAGFDDGAFMTTTPETVAAPESGAVK